MKKLLGLIALTLVLSGCSAVREGVFQQIKVTTDPPDATCRFFNTDGAIISTIASGGSAYNIHRSPRDLKIICSKLNYVDAVLTVQAVYVPKTNAYFWLGAGTDAFFGTHVWYPKEVHIKLRK